jgi:DNA-binding CsgD family transcriptional regulator
MGQWRLLLASGKVQRAASNAHQSESAFAAARNQIGDLAATIEDDWLRESLLHSANALILAARGLTDQQASLQKYGRLTRRERKLADNLIVSVKTVEAHVSRILSKLGFSSRSQIAAWAVEKGLAVAPKDLDSLREYSQKL